MKKILYSPLDLFFLILAGLPKPVLYLFSDIVYVIIFYFIGYRKKTVIKNIKESFPDKTKKELNHIIRKFYRHLSDITIENAALIKMSKKKVTSFVHYKNPDFFTELYKQKKNIIMVFGHYGNWEVTSTLPLYTEYLYVPVYKTVKNEYFNNSFLKMRSIFNCVPIPMESTLKRTLEYYKAKEPIILGLIADQRPLRKNIQYWTNFLNHETPVFMGPEKIGKKINAAIVFVDIAKGKRGLYNIEFSTLCENSADTKEYEITELFIRKLENQIMENPEFWLWSHDRWKHKKLD